LLHTFLSSTKAGEVFSAPFDVVFSNYDVVEPDLLVVLADQSEVITEKHVRGAPAIVVEMLSPGTKRVDEGIKLRLYDRTGVREYWLVDPKGDAVTILGRTPDGLKPAATFSRASGDVLVSALIPGFSAALDRIFGPPS